MISNIVAFIALYSSSSVLISAAPTPIKITFADGGGGRPCERCRDRGGFLSSKSGGSLGALPGAFADSPTTGTGSGNLINLSPPHSNVDKFDKTCNLPLYEFDRGKRPTGPLQVVTLTQPHQCAQGWVRASYGPYCLKPCGKNYVNDGDDCILSSAWWERCTTPTL